MQKDRQRTFRIRHSSYFFLLPTLIATQRVSHCPFSNNVSYALTAGLLCARKVLPIQGFPFCTTRLFLRHTSLLHNRQGPALTCRAGSATPRHMLKTSLIKKGLPKGDYRIQIFFFKCQFAVTTFFFFYTCTIVWKHRIEVKVVNGVCIVVELTAIVISLFNDAVSHCCWVKGCFENNPSISMSNFNLQLRFIAHKCV